MGPKELIQIKLNPLRLGGRLSEFLTNWKLITEKPLDPPSSQGTQTRVYHSTPFKLFTAKSFDTVRYRKRTDEGGGNGPPPKRSHRESIRWGRILFSMF